MSTVSRRQLLIFFGSSAAAAAFEPVISSKLLGTRASVAEAAPFSFTPVRLPHPLPVYQKSQSYYTTGANQGTVLPPASAPNLAEFAAIDDVVVPPQYERYVIASWGDHLFPNPDEYFGYNCDYTGFVPTRNNSNDGYLLVNHEYVSYPISRLAPGTPSDIVSGNFQETGPLVLGADFPTTRNRLLLGEFMYNMGVSIIRIARNGAGKRFAVVRDQRNRRVHGLSGLAINSTRPATDVSPTSVSYNTVTSWGSKSYQQGDENYLIGTGPAVADVFERVNADGLGNKIIGTGYNCSGGNTPWGTVLSAEENFQGDNTFFVGVQENVKPNGSQTSYVANTTGAEFGLVGEKYGWMVEFDPSSLDYRPRKHTALGRFRHENIACRVQAGQKLVAYLGDDRRGGHTWKFVSNGTVENPRSKSNSRLFEAGTLYVAKFNPDGTGEWIPLLLSTPTNPIRPSDLIANDPFASTNRNGNTRFPARPAGGTVVVTTANQATILPAYEGRTLADFYETQGAILCDAFPAANLVGGTPTARPEDLEVNPRNPAEVFIAYTDGAPGGDGYPDSRIFVVSKPSAAVNAPQPSGELFKLIETSPDGAGTSFRWERLSKGGEAGAEPGDGFANVDNLAFDNKGNLWGVTDMSTGAHNGFGLGAASPPLLIEHTVTGATSPSQTDSNLNVQTSNLIGVFGNNWLFYIPLSGQNAGEVVPFAYGPPRCEMTGPTFIGDTLIIAVQHPGEECPFSPQVTLSRTIEMLALDGTLFNQQRSVPRGSNWPSNIQGTPDGPPKPTVIGIRRKRPTGQFV